MINKSNTTPAEIRATVRLQFNQQFTFDHANDLVAYFSKLGVSHLYASPILTARQNSVHGYDIVNPTQVNAQLGGIDGLTRLVQTLRQHDMGLIIDIVPNHMGVGGHENPWWQHVLEWGSKSPYAFWFDIDWLSPDPQLNNKMLAPFLGDPYGVVLDKGEITLNFEAESGQIEARYFSHHFPIALPNYVEILSRSDADIFNAVIDKLESLDFKQDFFALEMDALTIFDALKSIYKIEAGQSSLDKALNFYNDHANNGISALHQLLENQHYRLTWWRNATDEINWRRFFEVSELAGIRVEVDEVFEATHAQIFELYKKGLIDGLRIDHIDGLANPQQYCRKLRSRLEELVNQRPLKLQQKPYLIAEKILGRDEILVEDWQLEGTTGYDFMEEVNALLHDPEGEKPLTSLWKKITKDETNFSQHVRNARRQLLSENLVGEFEATALSLHKIARCDIQTRDFSLASIRRVLTEILVYFPVYRTYITPPEKPSEADRFIFEKLNIAALRSLSNVDKPLLKLVLSWLSGDLVTNSNTMLGDLSRRAITRFQQLTPPLSAKSVEDTAFYRYARLLSRTEVGSDPDVFSMSVDEFHQRCMTRHKNYPFGMIATATHDHKRGEDARARLAVLSEIPLQWEEAVSGWFQLNAKFHQDIYPNDHLNISYSAPRPWHEYMLYQTLIGHWPYDLLPDDSEALQQYAERLNDWLLKSIREAKRFSNWIQANEDYESACNSFVFNVISVKNKPFIESAYAFVKKISSAGAINSLSTTLLRLTTPGLPDLYQGTEFWDFSLVDPDNRRAVDYAIRQQALDEHQDFMKYCENWENGAVKQHLIKQLLNVRKNHPALFKLGDYQPLTLSGHHNEHFIAFSRNIETEKLVIIAPRLTAYLHNNPDVITFTDKQYWENTLVNIGLKEESDFVDVLTNITIKSVDGTLALSQILTLLPFAVLMLKRN